LPEGLIGANTTGKTIAANGLPEAPAGVYSDRRRDFAVPGMQ